MFTDWRHLKPFKAMENVHKSKSDKLGLRIIGSLLAGIAVLAVVVLLVFMREPSKGPGNVPATGEATPLRDNGSAPTSK